MFDAVDLATEISGAAASMLVPWSPYKCRFSLHFAGSKDKASRPQNYVDILLGIQSLKNRHVACQVEVVSKADRRLLRGERRGGTSRRPKADKHHQLMATARAVPYQSARDLRANSSQRFWKYPALDL